MSSYTTAHYFPISITTFVQQSVGPLYLCLYYIIPLPHTLQLTGYGLCG
jgi:hypothetical protein